MANYPIPNNEDERIKELHELGILDTSEEEAYNRIVALASYITGAPISLVSLVDANRQWFKAKVGLGPRETPRDQSFCAHSLANRADEFFLVEDATLDKRFEENPLVLQDPHIRFYAGVPLKTPGGHNLGTLCVIDRVPRNLTKAQKEALITLSKNVEHLLELRKANLDLKEKLDIISRQNKKLERVDHLKGQIISILSHDLRSPIRSLYRFFNDLPDVMVLEIWSEIKEKALLNLKSTNSLLEGLLSWMDIYMENKELIFQRVVLRPALEEAIENLSLNAEHKGVKIVNQVPQELEAMVNRPMLLFAIRNLVDNAIKFTENGTVTLLSEIVANGIKIHVKDTGRGMSAEVLNLVKEAGKKITLEGTRKEKGSGIGLKLTREFLSLHNTSLEIESAVGKGSIFSFVLPKVEKA